MEPTPPNRPTIFRVGDMQIPDNFYDEIRKVVREEFERAYHAKAAEVKPDVPVAVPEKTWWDKYGTAMLAAIVAVAGALNTVWLTRTSDKVEGVDKKIDSAEVKATEAATHAERNSEQLKEIKRGVDDVKKGQPDKDDPYSKRKAKAGGPAPTNGDEAIVEFDASKPRKPLRPVPTPYGPPSDK